MGAERPIAAPMQERLATGVRGSGIWPRSLKTVRALSFPGGGYRFFPVVHFVRSKPKWGELPRWQGAAISGAEQPMATRSECTVNKIAYRVRYDREWTEKTPGSAQQPAHVQHGI
jgi:hypothetical protein